MSVLAASTSEKDEEDKVASGTLRLSLLEAMDMKEDRLEAAETKEERLDVVETMEDLALFRFLVFDLVLDLYWS